MEKQKVFSPVSRAVGEKVKIRAEFGVEVKQFCAWSGLTLDELAALSGVNFNTMQAVMYGRTPGYDVVPAVRKYMRQAVAENEARALNK